MIVQSLSLSVKGFFYIYKLSIMENLNVKIQGTSETGARFVAGARQFSIVIDEPPSLGGDDLGANPVEYLLASYAGCINVVAHLTARELGINLRKLSTTVDGEINPARLFGTSDTERAGFKHINVGFFPETDSEPDRIAEWVEVIKNRCPVNDNLSQPTPLSFNVSQLEDVA